MIGRRIVSIWLPHFAIQRWTSRHEASSPPEAPLALIREGTHGPVIHDVNAAAQRAAIRRDARLTDMRAIAPDLRVEEAEPERDAADLARLMRWSRRWAPWTQTDGTDGLLIDSTGSDHLHGGEAAMLADMTARFTALGLTVKLAIAPTIGAAWALARYGQTPQAICPSDAITAQLSPLPVGALRLSEDVVLLLRRLGLKTIGALIDLPSEALLRRFRRASGPDANPPLRLAQALGRQAELLVSPDIPAPLRVMRRMAEPLGDAAGLEQVLGDLASDLQNVLEHAGAGARGIRFTAYRVDGKALSRAVRTSRATIDPAHIVTLFDGQLDRIDPGFGIDAASLEAIDAEQTAAQQDDFAGQRRDDMDFARLIDRLTMRLGPSSILRPLRRGSHVPERGEQLVSLVDAPNQQAPPQGVNIVRRTAPTPLRLLHHPEEAEVVHAVPDGPPARFRWRYRLHDVARSSGPERIAPEWWREKSSARLRDYYHVEDSDGRRFWLFREGLASDRRGGNPRWFVHGLDA